MKEACSFKNQYLYRPYNVYIKNKYTQSCWDRWAGWQKQEILLDALKYSQ